MRVHDHRRRLEATHLFEYFSSKTFGAAKTELALRIVRRPLLQYGDAQAISALAAASGSLRGAIPWEMWESLVFFAVLRHRSRVRGEWRRLKGKLRFARRARKHHLRDFAHRPQRIAARSSLTALLHRSRVLRSPPLRVTASGGGSTSIRRVCRPGMLFSSAVVEPRTCCMAVVKSGRSTVVVAHVLWGSCRLLVVLRRSVYCKS